MEMMPALSNGEDNSRNVISLPTPEQEDVLTNPNSFLIFIHLMDRAFSSDEIARSTGLKPIEIAVHLDRMVGVRLVEAKQVIPASNKTVRVLYDVVNRNLDLSAVANQFNPLATLDLLYSKVKTDLMVLHDKKTFKTDSEIKYMQIKVNPRTFEKLQQMMHAMEKMIMEEENNTGEDSVTMLLIGYKSQYDA